LLYYLSPGTRLHSGAIWLPYYVTESSPKDGGDDGAPASPLSAYSCIPFQPILAYLSYPNALVANGGCHVVITTNIRVNRMAGQFLEVIRKYSRRWNVTARGTGQADIVITLYACNQEVLGSNPGRDTGYSEWSFRGVP
jgi:hypothetical protein